MACKRLRATIPIPHAFLWEDAGVHQNLIFSGAARPGPASIAGIRRSASSGPPSMIATETFFCRHDDGASGLSPMARAGAARAGPRQPAPPALAGPRLPPGYGAFYMT